MNMTDKDLKKLADMVAAKIVLELFGDADTRAKAKEHFESDFNKEDPLSGIFADMTDEEMLIGELARLQTILMIYEDQDTPEGYQKAARVYKKLRLIQKKLGKL